MSAEIRAPAVLAEHVDGIAEMSSRLDALESAGATPARDRGGGRGLRSPSPMRPDAGTALVPIPARASYGNR